MSPSDALLVIAKRPAPGQTKTRLCPPLTPEQAAELYERTLVDTIALARSIGPSGSTNPEGFLRGALFLPQEAREYFARLAPDFELIAQEGASLGVRLDNALTGLLASGVERAVIVNSDGPTLPAKYLRAAFDALRGGAEAVFGPCEDGGYYLVGATRPIPRVLREVRMSTPRVLADTLALAREERLRVALLPEWWDVDEPGDLARLARELESAGPGAAPATRAWLLAQRGDERPRRLRNVTE